MNPNISSSLDRADELLNELETEYNRSLELKQVSPRAVQITHEVCEKPRGILDRIARRYWEQYVAPELSPDCNERATVYFPISPDQSAFDSTIVRWQWKSVRSKHQRVYDYLLKLQPF